MKRYGLYVFVALLCTAYSFSETLEIQCAQPVLVYNNHVGNEWVFDVQIAGEDCPLGGTVKIESNALIEVVFSAREMDKIVDYGSSTFEIDPAALKTGKKQYADIEVIVTENRGRYSGNTAQWRMRVSFLKL